MHGSLTIEETKAGRVIRPAQFHNKSGPSGLVPSLAQLLREGRASKRRIDEHDHGIKRFRKLVLTEWLDQAERLWLAAEIHGLKGKHFEVFAAQIGIDRSSAYELLKLHPHRKTVLARCSEDKHWPGWEVCASWFKRGEPEDIEPEEPTTRNRGLLTPTWQRFKTSHDEYGTPQALFDHYDRVHHFTIDVCATPELAKCKKFFTREQDGLKHPWLGHVAWMNPPYSDLGQWVRKGYEEAQLGAVVVALLPVFTDAAWFHDYASHATIDLLKGRLQFGGRQAYGYSPFGHMVCTFRQTSARTGRHLTISLLSETRFR